MNSRGVTPPAAWGCIKTRPPVAHSLTLSDVPCAGAPKSRRDPRTLMRRLYRSLDGRLETTKTQFDVMHHFSNINAPSAVLCTRNGFLMITIDAVMRVCRPRRHPKCSLRDCQQMISQTSKRHMRCSLPWIIC